MLVRKQNPTDEKQTKTGKQVRVKQKYAGEKTNKTKQLGENANKKQTIR